MALDGCIVISTRWGEHAAGRARENVQGSLRNLRRSYTPFGKGLTETKDLGAAGRLQWCNFEASKKQAAHNTFKSG